MSYLCPEGAQVWFLFVKTLLNGRYYFICRIIIYSIFNPALFSPYLDFNMMTQRRELLNHCVYVQSKRTGM